MRTIGGQILCPTPEGDCVLRPGVVTIADQMIAGLDFGEVPESVDEGGADTLISPGLIDTHLHFPQFDSIGAFGLPLLPWLEKNIFPAEIRWNDPEFAQEMTRRVIRQCLSVGTTAVCAYATVSYESTLAALEECQSAGLRGVVGQALMDRGAPPELLRPTDQLIDDVANALDRYPAHGRLATAVTPRFALSCTDDLMHAAGKLAAENQAVIQTHLAETIPEVDAVNEEFGRPYVDVYRERGLLTDRTLLGHGIHLSREEQQQIADSGAIIAHCPTANRFLGSGAMHRSSHLQAGITLSLGSDIGAGYERSMVRVGRAMIEAAMQLVMHPGDQASDPPTASQAWYQITRGNANALGWQDAGQISVDAPADLLIVRPDVPWRETQDPLSTLMFSWDDRWVVETVLLGRTTYRSASHPR